MPKYQSIADKLIDQLDHGRFSPGERFYSEQEISHNFNVSSTTAVKVLNTLQELNRVTRIQGKGTFVAKEAHHRIVLLTDMNMAGEKSENVKVLSAKIDNQADILKMMRLPSNNHYLEVIRLRYIGDVVSQYSISYLNSQYINSDDISDLSKFSSIYQRIRDDSNIDPYKLPFHQKNIAKSIDNQKILDNFQSVGQQQMFICQYRKTFLPTQTDTLLEYAISYKLPQFWGFSADATSVYPNM
ncbi:GntR family transcriptional regulator [Lactiplantibacillus fabifermentans]|uniref:HTH gntR-type domain-containing protein n=2 Tax=Lactiplantibacillus fabifermentans TaxID=483011 RepID=A0A0R2NR51_9LACO|nr:GntR family transcriptional regulator [Lactiplantibacillus fabifermentans]ETY73168.1 GntR family transcriptional regulator [Lactiplantibacillus fabifermentans T30PCM01]KRO27852.1 hypothetical protein DY78_GL002845 [Lactiplantibacillus fabifermentans DSM 21115]